MHLRRSSTQILTNMSDLWSEEGTSLLSLKCLCTVKWVHCVFHFKALVHELPAQYSLELATWFYSENDQGFQLVEKHVY